MIQDQHHPDPNASPNTGGTSGFRAPRTRATPLAARGEPMVWLTGAALIVCVLMIVLLLATTVWQGARTFWPRPIDRIQLRDGTVLMGVPMTQSAYDPSPDVRRRIESLHADGLLHDQTDAFDQAGRPIRRLYRVGNREFAGQPFIHVPLFEIVSVERPTEAVFVERLSWGIWIGSVDALVRVERVETSALAADVPQEGLRTIDGREARYTQRIIEDRGENGVTLERRTYLAERSTTDLADPATTSPDKTNADKTSEVWNALNDILPTAAARRSKIRSLENDALGAVNHKLNNARLQLEKVRLAHSRTAAGGRSTLSIPAWLGLLVTSAACFAAARFFRRRHTPPITDTVFRPRLPIGATASIAGSAAVGLFVLLLATLHNPWSSPDITDERLAEAVAAYELKQAELNVEYDRIFAEINILRTEDSADRVIITEATNGRFAPRSQTEPDEPMPVSGIVRIFKPNTLSFTQKLGVYTSRWWEYITAEPRESNTEGGIFPVIFGTVALTIMLSVVVMPLGVIAALYIREYAKQGLLISAVRIAVNNLAGVPSIVYGTFGLGFFCYTLGTWIDRGPGEAAVATPSGWWLGVALCLLTMLAAIIGASLCRPKPGQLAGSTQRIGAILVAAAWVVAVIGTFYLIYTTPYFNGFYAYKGAGTPTFGTKGLLWASLTLALLTLPVVIVATEEAIAAVPRTMREGSYGCGASQWQTIRRIVMPRAMPGVMTGMILAMARGAGEVAPLLLVGAVKLAPSLPIDFHAPFIHLERTFMHLGFHIYDVGFQSPDSEAARPLVWTTTLLLILIVLAMNISAIRIRARLRRKFVGGAF